MEGKRIAICGEEYIQKPERKSKALSPVIQSALIMAGMFYPGHERQQQRPRVDIVKEYELIQLKKSKLSRSNRDWVESVFHRNFIKI